LIEVDVIVVISQLKTQGGFGVWLKNSDCKLNYLSTFKQTGLFQSLAAALFKPTIGASVEEVSLLDKS